MAQQDFQPDALAAAEKLVEHARSRGIEPVAFATAWVLANPFITCAIAGPRTYEQWESYLPAMGVVLSDEDERAVDAVVPAGTTAVPHYIDPSYPVEGRPSAAKYLAG